MNAYGFGSGDPIDNSDPFGLCCDFPGLGAAVTQSEVQIIHEYLEQLTNGLLAGYTGLSIAADQHSDHKEEPADEAADESSKESADVEDELILSDDYWQSREAATQVEPGARQITDLKPSSRKAGEVYERRTFYDQYGRQVGQSHLTDHGEPEVHPNPHHHVRNPVTGQRSGPQPGLHPNDPGNP